MKKIFYSIMALALLTACSNEDMLQEVPNEGLIELASIGIGTQTRGRVDDEGEFSFSDGDKVLMKVEVNENSISNSFTYNAAGNKWTQDAPVGNYRSIYVQDNPTINSIVSYGGDVQKIFYTDQSSMEKYAKASSLAADPMRYLGDISIDGNIVTARLDHDNSDLALKVYDGYDEKNTLAEGTPVLKVIIDIDGQGPASITETYTAWNAGKASDADGNVYTLFRVQLRNFSSILKAELSNVNATAGDLKTEILFRASDGQPSNEIDLEAGRRYSASYTYDMLKTVATVNVSISAFEDNPNQNITASKEWSFDETTKTYTVFTAEGLQIVNQDITKNIATKGDYNITLAADITLPDPVAPETSNWTMLGYFDWSDLNEYLYEGTFDGAGHTIRNLQINEPTANDAALVYGLSNNGAVKNLTLENPVIYSDDCAAGIVASNSLYAPNAFVTNCHIKGGDIKSSREVGGIAGEYYGNMLACTVSETTIEGYAIGGIVGSMNFGGRIIACGVNEVKFIPSSNNASVGGIAGYLNAWSLDGEAIHIYSCYIKDCTKGTDLQALEGTANMTSAVCVYGDCSLSMYNCAYRTKGNSITYGVCGTESEQTNNDYTVDMFITQIGMISTDWSIAASNLNEGIRDWNEYNPTLPCNWEWDATAEGKLKVKQ